MASLSKSASSFAVVFSALLAVLLLITTLVSACGFDAIVEQQSIQDLAKPAPKNLPDISSRRAATYAPIRIKVFFEDLYDTNKYCTAVGQSKPDFKGGSLTCTAEDVFTTAKRSELVNIVIPNAIAEIEKVLNVVRLTSNNVVGTTTQCTGGFTIPSAHTTTGVADADYVLYVAAGPTASGNVAWAGACQNDGGSPNRPTVGRANFGPRYLSRTTMPLHDIVRTGVHEIAHALGYSYSEFNARSMVTDVTIRGISKKFITTSGVKNEARKWMACGSLSGVELENEGGAGTANSHVDRRVYKDDLMAGAGGEVISPVFLAIMEGLGVYTANYTHAENMITGKGMGCTWSEGTCADNTLGFCGSSTDSNVEVGCASNLKGYGPCSTGFLTDGCRYHNSYSNKKCYDDSQTDDVNTGDSFHNNSRCYNTKNSFKKLESTVVPGTTFRCLKSQCFGGILSFTVGRDAVNYHTCTTDNQEKAYSGYQGNVVCPNISLMCSSLQRLANSSSENEALNPQTPVIYGKTNRATDWIYTTKLTLTLNGAGWGTLIKNYYSDLFVAMQADVAQILSIESQQVWVKYVLGSSNTVSFEININAPDKSSNAIQSEFQYYLGRRAWMPRTASLYDDKSGASDKSVLGAAGAADKATNACTPYMPSFEDTDQCNGFIAGIVIAALAFLFLVICSIYQCCCKYEDPPEKVNRSVKYEVKVSRG